MNRIQRRVLGAALAVASSATVLGVAAPAAHATTVTPAGPKHWLCNYGGESARISYGAGYHDGKQGPVKQAQCLLDLAGSEPHLTMDGLFGPSTRKSVVHFQFAHGLNPDGIVGPNTWAALQRYNRQV